MTHTEDSHRCFVYLCMIHRDLQILLASRGRFLCPGTVFVVAMMSGAAPAGIATGRGVLAKIMSKQQWRHKWAAHVMLFCTAFGNLIMQNQTVTL